MVARLSAQRPARLLSKSFFYHLRRPLLSSQGLKCRLHPRGFVLIPWVVQNFCYSSSNCSGSEPHDWKHLGKVQVCQASRDCRLIVREWDGNHGFTFEERFEHRIRASMRDYDYRDL
jgi:hypothetical protein